MDYYAMPPHDTPPDSPLPIPALTAFPGPNEGRDGSGTAPPRNPTILQGFEWYCPADYKHWKRLEDALPSLSKLGVESIWIPPACKTFSHGSTGYDTYDIFDLGEYYQHGQTQTKYGSKAELLALTRAAEARGMSITFDVVINHKAGADRCEDVHGVRVDPMDRLHEISAVEEIGAWTGFEFLARNGQHSAFKWNKSHFSGVDYDERTRLTAIWKFEGKEWAPDADSERGSYDYLMFANIDHSNREVRQELFSWVDWLGKQMPLGGMRLDAIKHISKAFVKAFVDHIFNTLGPNLQIVGEYWTTDSQFLADYIRDMGNKIFLYDIQLVHKFRDLSMATQPDLRTAFVGSLASLKPDNTITFVVNHDTQEGQTSQTLVAPWFIPLAYSLILLRERCGTPCVFYGDLYGSFGPVGHRQAGIFEPPPAAQSIAKMMLVRQFYAYGPEELYFHRPECVGFTRRGHRAYSGHAGVAVVLNSSDDYQSNTMCVGVEHTGEHWTDVLGNVEGEVVIHSSGWATFPVSPRGVSVWVDSLAIGREVLDGFVFDENIYDF